MKSPCGSKLFSFDSDGVHGAPVNSPNCVHSSRSMSLHSLIVEDYREFLRHHCLIFCVNALCIVGKSLVCSLYI